MHHGINLLGGHHLLKALGIDNGWLEQLERYQDQVQVLHDLRDQFQMAVGALSANMLAGMLQSGAIAAAGMMPPPSPGHCRCPGNYAAPQTFDFGATPGLPPWSFPALMNRAQGSMFERFLKTNPFARQQFEMAMGGRIVCDGIDDGRVTIQPFPPGAFPAGGLLNSPFALASSMLGAYAAGQVGGAFQQGFFQGAMLNALANMLNGVAAGPFGAGGLPRTPGGGSPFVDWFPPPIPGGGGYANGPFQPGQAGANQGQFALGASDGSDVASVLNDSSLTVEDKVCLMLMLIMKKMDQDIERQAQEINKMQQQQNGGKKGGKGGKGGGGGGGGGSSPSIDVETMKLKRLIDKRSQMFDMLRQIIDKYNQTAKGIIDSMGR